jgi:hypothetical protein
MNEDGERTAGEDSRVAYYSPPRQQIHRPGRPLYPNHLVFEDRPHPVSPVTDRAPVEVVTRDTTALERPQSYYTHLFQQMGLQERPGRVIRNMWDALSAPEQAPAPSPPSELDVRQTFE